MIPRILGTSRFLILIAVIGSFLSATLLIIYGGFTVIDIMVDTIQKGSPNPAGAKELIVSSIEMIDLFLLCVVLYIIATGLYKLFVGPIDIPVWLQISTLDELKAQLINVVIVLLAVIFLGQVVTQHQAIGIGILYLGIAISAVIFALVYTMRHVHKAGGENSRSDSHTASDAAKPHEPDEAE